MASPVFHDVRGDDWEWTCQVTRDHSSDPIPGLGEASSMVSTMKRYVDDTNQQSHSTSAITVVNDELGYIVVEWPATTTAAIEPGMYWCDIQIVLEGKKRTIGPFVVSVVGDVTTT